MNRSLLAVSLCLCAALLLPAQRPDPEKYAEVKLPAIELARLEAIGLSAEHGRKIDGGGLTLVLNQDELSQVQRLGIPYQVLVEDLAADYRHKLKASARERSEAGCGLTNYDAGSMGGYHTLDQALAHIEAMATAFPALVSKFQIGASLEGRPIWAVKLSDNVGTDESAGEGVVYFDGLIHAREPISLEVQLYFMWWLLEHYGSLAEATYLIDHREMYFVPVVNPDGYVFNEQSNPEGGGYWRKNRRPDASGCYGVDLNRNFGYQWGLDSGSGSDPCTEIYRGTAAFSEPETQAIRDFLADIEPAIGFTLHSANQSFLSPFGFGDTVPEFSLYSELASEFIPRDYLGYGTTKQFLNYYSSGTTRDWMQAQGIYGWTPEIGLSFWELPDVICYRVQEFAPAMKYLCWVAGQYTRFQDFTLLNQDRIWLGDTLALHIRVKNRGLTQAADDVSVTLNPLHPALEPLVPVVSYGILPRRTLGENTAQPFQFRVSGPVQAGEWLALEVIVRQSGHESDRDTLFVSAGQAAVLLEDECENSDHWISFGEGLPWDTTGVDMRSHHHSIADSRDQNYLPLSDNTIRLAVPIDLGTAQHPFVEFDAKWSLEPYSDFVQLELSADNGLTWLPLESPEAGPLYTRNFFWRQERIDLSDFIGNSILLQFRLSSEASVQGDGFYFDDFRVVDYSDPAMVAQQEPGAAGNYRLRLHPNPAQENVRVQVEADRAMPARLRVVDALGQTLHHEPMALEPGTNALSLNLKALPAGLYFIKIDLSGPILVSKIAVE